MVCLVYHLLYTIFYYIGPIPPWFKRYGHSLDAVDINGDGVSDVMILMGGYSPSPSNDIWITEDGVNWGYVSMNVCLSVCMYVCLYHHMYACIYKMYIRMYHIVSIYIPIISLSITILSIISSSIHHHHPSLTIIIIIINFFVIVRIVDEPPPWSARAWHFTVTFKGTL